MDIGLALIEDPPKRKRLALAIAAGLGLLAGCFGAKALWTGSIRDLSAESALAIVRQDTDPDHVRGACVALYRFNEASIVELRRISYGSDAVAANARALVANLRALLKE